MLHAVFAKQVCRSVKTTFRKLRTQNKLSDRVIDKTVCTSSNTYLKHQHFYKRTLVTSSYRNNSKTMEFGPDNAPDADVLFTSEDEKTFAYQDKLPSLPVPDLSKTLKKYLNSAKPHLTEAEYRHTEAIVQDFESGIGKDLHQKLLKRASCMRNWLATWWEDFAYMEGRYPIAPLVNMGGPGPYLYNYHPKKDGTQIERAAMIVHFALRYWKIIRTERLKPQKDSHGNPMCMSQFMKAFNICRIPGVHKDRLISYFKTESQGPTPVHLIVLCNGRIFKFDAVDNNDIPFTPLELQVQFQRIKDVCDGQPEGPGLGALTGDNRTTWAENRSRLLALHPDNFHNLELIQSSIVVVSLDDYKPVDESDLLHNVIGGNPRKRWFDKGQCMVFYENGLTATNCDHGPVDGMMFVTATFYNYLQLLHCKGKWQGSTKIKELSQPEELVFHIDDHLMQEIERSAQQFTATANNIGCVTKHFTGYGKTYLRSMGLHPDTHVQLAIQYTYYKLHRKPAATYETATTRKFYLGRTETMRSCTEQSVEWTKAMLDSIVPNKRKKELYQIAADTHNRLMAEATNLEGCDRHLLGLYRIAEEEGIPVPSLYTDVAYTKSGGGGNFTLSTSGIGYTAVYGGVAAMTEDGYGAFYKIPPDEIVPIITTWKTSKVTNAERFCDTFMWCLEDMKKMLDKEQPSPAKL